MYYCNINYAFNLKSNLGYTYPLVEQSMQKPRLSKYKFFKNFDSSVLLKVRSHMTLRNGENREKGLEAKKSMRCEVRTTRCLGLRQWWVHRVPAAYSQTFPRMTLVIWRPEHWDRDWETLRSGCLVLRAHAILSKTQNLFSRSSVFYGESTFPSYRSLA